MMAEIQRNLYSLHNSLLAPPVTLEGTCKIWINHESGAMPESANDTIHQIQRISDDAIHRISDDIGGLISEAAQLPQGEMDVTLSGHVARQLQALASELQKDIENLAPLVDTFNTMDIHGVEAGSLANTRRLIVGGWQQFQSFVSAMKNCRAEFLTEYDGYEKVLNMHMNNTAEG